jgi:hypothetical protein
MTERIVQRRNRHRRTMQLIRRHTAKCFDQLFRGEEDSELMGPACWCGWRGNKNRFVLIPSEVRVAAIESVGKLCETRRASPIPTGRLAATSIALPQSKQIAFALMRAMRDPEIHVRAEAVLSLARVGPSAGITDPGPIKEAIENDPAIEVRNAAKAALFTGWPEHFRHQDALGR